VKLLKFTVIELDFRELRVEQSELVTSRHPQERLTIEELEPRVGVHESALAHIDPSACDGRHDLDELVQSDTAGP
jgi:hypothetical protein